MDVFVHGAQCVSTGELYRTTTPVLTHWALLLPSSSGRSLFRRSKNVLFVPIFGISSTQFNTGGAKRIPHIGKLNISGVPFFVKLWKKSIHNITHKRQGCAGFSYKLLGKGGTVATFWRCIRNTSKRQNATSLHSLFISDIIPP